ncbi:helix-turn-helix domain-containing protein [Emergencia timonensis]|uniref:helix-turn-helix domain-containing protein n=1 Tax=Emergencia timonensis TaxID=1776384 RepID=UPI001D0751AD|nr:helix-turn-helix domain-containing protein [Emergencia timonensis]MCB6475560.1 helix-turn-helix domain-containing protein [Emergencia timonensis]
MEDILYTIPEAAEMMKTSQGCVHNLRKAGLLKCLKLGSYKVRRAELERFLQEYEGKDVTDPYNVKDLVECSEKVHKTI